MTLALFGTDGVTKASEFSEKFQTAFDPPPPSFSENHIAVFFPEFMTEEPFIMAKICNLNFLIGNAPAPLGTFPKIHTFF